MKHSRLRAAGSFRLALLALVALLGIAGYMVTSQTIRSDRNSAAGRRAQVDRTRSEALLDRAKAYVVGLGNVLAGEPVPNQRRFAQLTGTAGSVDLVDAMWVESVPGPERSSFERRHGARITRLTPNGSFEPAPPASSYLPTTFTTQTRPELRVGVDVSEWPALAAAIRDRASVFAVSASERGALAGQPGFCLVEAGSFGHGPDSRGYLVVFVPERWLTVSQQEDPRRMAISLDGQHLEWRLDSPPVASASFSTLGRRWRIDVTTEPATGLQTLLPWLSLAWPIAAALIVLLVGRAIVGRRQAERDVERFFDLSLDMLCTASFDGYFKRVNPAFEQTLGYSSRELLSRPFFDFVHPDDVEATREAMRALARGEAIHQFENRYIRSDGSERWLEWSTRPGAGEGLVYAVARDVTDRRRAEDEQTALRRVATLVAARGSQREVFDAVAAEVGHILQADMTRLLRYEPDGTATVVAARNRPGLDTKVGTRLTLEGESVAASVLRSGRAARIDSFEGAPGSIAATLRGLGMRTAAGAPIIVEGRLWGVIVAAWQQQQPRSADTESRIAQFTELVATAIANAEGRAELAASRARVVTAGDDTRRRIERDLHDGTQQRLVSLGIALRATETKVPPELTEVRAELAQTKRGLEDALDDLREISRGIHPAILSQGGMGAALKALARRASVPVKLDIRASRPLPERVEVTAYYVVSEALTNAVKHAHASLVHVDVDAQDSIVELVVRDNGVGGADPARGSGLIGLRDRVEALGGTLEIASSPGNGTSLLVKIPIDPTEKPDR